MKNRKIYFFIAFSFKNKYTIICVVYYLKIYIHIRNFKWQQILIMIPVPERKRCREPGKEPSENKISLQKKMFPKEEKTSAERILLSTGKMPPEKALLQKEKYMPQKAPLETGKYLQKRKGFLFPENGPKIKAEISKDSA